MIVNVWASHAFHSPRKSSQVSDEDNPCPNVEDSVEIAIHLQPNSMKNKNQNICHDFSRQLSLPLSPHI